MGDPHLVDTAVLAYAIGGAHPLKPACLRLLEAAGQGSLTLHASVEMVQELAFHRMRRVDRATAVQQAKDAAVLCELHPFDEAVLHRFFDVIMTSSLGGRDAVHAATALEHGLTTIISPDRAFEGIPGLRRIDPASVELFS